ncbi:tripartite tricarboxylate transporter substrate binding protein [Granulosicoccus sp.]|nr:tripartite tricarboxylate transporter substrate binding protein [Granulosicoccus sp.]
MFKLINKLLTPFFITIIAMSSAVSLALADYPDKPITIMFPWAAGDPTETVMRVLGEIAKEKLGQPVVINIVQGAGGKKSLAEIAKATPDGYTLANNWVAPQIAGKLFDPNLPYDNTSFIPVAGVTAIPFTVTVIADHKANNIQELITWAKQKGGKLNYGVCAGQSIPRLVGEQFMRSAGLDFVSVPNNTGCMGDNMTGLLNGSLDVSVGILPATRIFAGQVKHLGLISDVPHSLAPNLKTVKEQGVELGWGDAALGWGGLVLPKDTPEEIVVHLQNVIGETIQSDRFKEALGPLANMIRYVPPGEFETLWTDSMELLKPYVNEIREYDYVELEQ